tara:strand:- start:5915 stop:6094 length:180 start_codon:yes stop_codon:yes gene_type:complete
MKLKLTAYQLGMLVRKGVYNAKIKVRSQKQEEKVKKFSIAMMSLSRDLIDEIKSKNQGD